MRSMRTSGASKNRDCCYTKWLAFSSWANLEKTEVPMVCISTYGMYNCISTYGMYKYLWYVYVPKVCISTYGMYKYLWYV